MKRRTFFAVLGAALVAPRAVAKAVERLQTSADSELIEACRRDPRVFAHYVLDGPVNCRCAWADDVAKYLQQMRAGAGRRSARSINSQILGDGA